MGGGMEHPRGKGKREIFSENVLGGRGVARLPVVRRELAPLVLLLEHRARRVEPLLERLVVPSGESESESESESGERARGV